MTSSWRICKYVASALLAVGMLHAMAWAAPFTASYTDGASWNTLYAQGFNAFVNDGLSEPLDIGDPVPLSRFEFFKSGNVDEAANIQLAIITPFFINLDGLTTASDAFVGVSSNTIASTASIATGDPLRFNFDDLELSFGEYYAAVFVNIDELGNVTPVLVSALHTDYVETEPGSGVFLPESNYDFDPENPTDYFTSTSNFLNIDEFGTFFAGFEGAGDANFVAYFDYTFDESTPGDFDEDGDVDGADFLIWQRGGSPTPLSAGDLTNWQNNYDNEGLVAVVAVPEPSSFAILCAMGSGLLIGRRNGYAQSSRI
jgi:hypothetical protein